MSAGIVGICARLAAAGLGAALVVIGGTAPAAAAASPNASCVGQIVSAAAPVIVPVRSVPAAGQGRSSAE